LEDWSEESFFTTNGTSGKKGDFEEAVSLVVTTYSRCRINHFPEDSTNEDEDDTHTAGRFAGRADPRSERAQNKQKKQTKCQNLQDSH